MARLGADVVGADAAPRNIPVAQIHAEQEGLTIDYRHTTAEDLAAAGEQFDVVLNMEVVEHVADPLAYLTACQQLLKPGGLMICSTLNRNPKSYVMAIIGAEYVMRWLPKGTHDWSKFITPDELYDLSSSRRAGPGGPHRFCVRQAAVELVPVGTRPVGELCDSFSEALNVSLRNIGKAQGLRYPRNTPATARATSPARDGSMPAMFTRPSHSM